MPKPLQLTPEEIAASFAVEPWASKYPPILSMQQFAELCGVSLSTVKSWLGHGDFVGATTRMGRHRRIFRDRAIRIAFGRARTRPRSKSKTRTKKESKTNDETIR